MSKSEQNLQEAFAGESQANRKYLAFAKKAEEEGYHQVARLFRAAAAAETVHAHNHLKELAGVRKTKENLESALNGEVHEFQNMYPRMIKEAGEENNKCALRTFTFANEVEKVHADLFKRAIETLGQEAGVEYHVCQICGHTVEGEPPDTCPICGAKKQMFQKID
ncbi:MAG: rubrerythrin family protein [Alphaproteobacteria bacterium]|uniref:Rubrerythrin family protein n=1 Tax=Candidatus Nitrobium versatile TaxID=2884831 RepID=A0A953LWX0_9BACT|nr:rubrerythrin family protein [Candidatus Nitrobium versatile]